MKNNYRVEEYTKPDGTKEFFPQVWSSGVWPFNRPEWHYLRDAMGRYAVCETLAEAENFLKWFEGDKRKYHKVNL